MDFLRAYLSTPLAVSHSAEGQKSTSLFCLRTLQKRIVRFVVAMPSHLGSKCDRGYVPTTLQGEARESIDSLHIYFNFRSPLPEAFQAVK